MYYVKEPNFRDLAHFSFQKNFVENIYSVNYFSIKYQIFFESWKVQEGHTEVSTSPITWTALILTHSCESSNNKFQPHFAIRQHNSSASDKWQCSVRALTGYTEVLPVSWEEHHSYTHHPILQVAACTDERGLFLKTDVLWKIGQSKVEENIPLQEEIPSACKNRVVFSKKGGRLQLIASLKRDENVFKIF